MGADIGYRQMTTQSFPNPLIIEVFGGVQGVHPSNHLTSLQCFSSTDPQAGLAKPFPSCLAAPCCTMHHATPCCSAVVAPCQGDMSIKAFCNEQRLEDAIAAAPPCQEEDGLCPAAGTCGLEPCVLGLATYSYNGYTYLSSVIIMYHQFSIIAICIHMLSIFYIYSNYIHILQQHHAAHVNIYLPLLTCGMALYIHAKYWLVAIPDCSSGLGRYSGSYAEAHRWAEVHTGCALSSLRAFWLQHVELAMPTPDEPRANGSANNQAAKSRKTNGRPMRNHEDQLEPNPRVEGKPLHVRPLAGEITYRAPTNCHTALAGRKPQEGWLNEAVEFRLLHAPCSGIKHLQREEDNKDRSFMIQYDSVCHDGFYEKNSAMNSFAGVKIFTSSHAFSVSGYAELRGGPQQWEDTRSS